MNPDKIKQMIKKQLEIKAGLMQLYTVQCRQNHQDSSELNAVKDDLLQSK